jgi:integrase
MAIRKLPSGNYQARLQGPDGKIVTAVFASGLEAEEQVLKWKEQKERRTMETKSIRSLCLNEYFEQWFQDVAHEGAKECQSGWRERQYQYYRDYIGPEIGTVRIRELIPVHIKRVLSSMSSAGRAPQTQRLVFATLRKLFSDAIESYQYLTFNPALKKLKPSVPVREAKHLNLNQVKMLLVHVENRKYGLAIWLQLYLGLRVGELIALRWEDIDLDSGRITIRSTYIKTKGLFRDYPKGGKHHSHQIPEELLEKLKVAARKRKNEWVVASPKGNHLPYRWYLVTLKRYCEELKLPDLGTHSLRHSTSELYIHHGATRDDLQRLFAHSSPRITELYVHDHGTQLEKIAKVIRVFDGQKSTTPSKTDDDRPRKSTTRRFFQDRKVLSH